MSVLDFKEISPPSSGAARDSFELFARDFFVFLGLRVTEGPDRGPDGGRDLIVVERRLGTMGETDVRWLVSCKHKAHSGSAVGVDDEQNIRDRVEAHGCGGFIGFYSTLSSSGLTTLLKDNKKFEVQLWDHERIEQSLLRGSEGVELARRYFPNSIGRWLRSYGGAVDLYAGAEGLKCEHCGKDLLDPPAGIVVFLDRDIKPSDADYPTEIVDIYWSCKAGCDRALLASRRTGELVDHWKDIPDIVSPVGFIQSVMATTNRLRGGERYSDSAFAKYRRFLLEVFRHVAREPTQLEKQRTRLLASIPSWLGGMASDDE